MTSRAYTRTGVVHRTYSFGSDSTVFARCSSMVGCDPSKWREPLVGVDRPCWQCFGNPYERDGHEPYQRVNPDVWTGREDNDMDIPATQLQVAKDVISKAIMDYLPQIVHGNALVLKAVDKSAERVVSGLLGAGWRPPEASGE